MIYLEKIKNNKNPPKTVVVTGAAGFIGFHLSRKLLQEGCKVIGIDCMSDYYDVSLKEARESILMENTLYTPVREKIENQHVLMDVFGKDRPDIVVHLAAQAGVRYSIENPRAYLETNINGTFELLEAARAFPPQHMLLASTSSVYGANQTMPYAENTKVDNQMSFYAATKKATENMAHSYAHLFKMPITMFRFFTVYGPWGRPDMALFKFTNAILQGKPIDVYNYGKLSRDFTYIDDIIESISSLIKVIPNTQIDGAPNTPNFDSLSPVAPYRVVNIGNSKPVSLADFISAIEKATGVSAVKNYLPMQSGDVAATWADTSLLSAITGLRPHMNLDDGVERSVRWFKDYYQC